MQAGLTFRELRPLANNYYDFLQAKLTRRLGAGFPDRLCLHLVEGQSVTTPRDSRECRPQHLRGPEYFNADASLMRNFKLTERFTFQLEADALSLTKAPHFNNPVNDGGNADIAGIISAPSLPRS